MNTFYVAEIVDGKTISMRDGLTEEQAQELFKVCVSEYGTEPWEELVDEGIFQADDYTVQWGEIA